MRHGGYGMKQILPTGTMCHPRINGDPAARVYAPNDSYARYRSRWIPAFAGMTHRKIVSSITGVQK